MLVPFVLPTVVVATAFLALLPDGVERSVWAILLAHVFFNVAVVVRVVGAFWAGLDERLWDAAATLGASPARRQLARHAPAPRPGARVRGVDRVPLLLHVVRRDRRPRRAALRDARDGDLQPGGAALRPPHRGGARAAPARRGRGDGARLREARAAARRPRAATGRARASRPGARAPRRGRGRPRRRSRCSSLPPLALVVRSLQVGDGYGLDHFASLAHETPALLVAPWHAVVNSLLFATAATAIALAVGIPAAVAVARRATRRSTSLVMLPLGASAAMLGFGFLLAFDDPPLDLRSSPGSSRSRRRSSRCPFVVRALVPALRAVDARLREAAAVLGASPAAGPARDRAAAPRARRSPSRPGSRSPSRSASSARRCSSPGPTGRRSRWRSSASSAGPAPTTSGTAMALCVVLMGLVAAVALVSERALARGGDAVRLALDGIGVDARRQRRSSRASTSRSRRASGSRCSGRAARASPRCCA